MSISLFCWGDRLTPHLVLDQTDDAVIIQVNDEPKTIQQSKVKGWAREGDRVRVLMGSDWFNGTVLGGDTLRVDLDKLGIVPIHKTGVMQPLYVPASELANASDDKASSVNDSAPESLITSKKSRRKKLKSTEAAPPCDFCGDPSTLWCDGRIKTGVHHLGTCDRPMCRSCAKQVGNMFGCNRRKPSQSFADTVDWCPDCVNAHEHERLTKRGDFVGKGEPVKEFSSALVDKLSTVPSDLDHNSEDKLTDQGDLVTKGKSLSPAPVFKEGDRVRLISKDSKFVDLFGVVGHVVSYRVFSGTSLCMVRFKRHGEKSFPPEALEIVADNLLALNVGDRVRIVLAGPPLEHLVGSLGTVEGEETFGLIPVKIDGDRSVVLRREQVDKIEAGHPCIGSKVQSDRAFKAKVGIVREIKDGTAMVEFGAGIPLYPCAITSLRVVS